MDAASWSAVGDQRQAQHGTAGGTDGPGGAGRQASDDPDRRETEAERDDRNLMELLQELRVAALGVQVLFGFLLSLPFTVRFDKLDPVQRHLYVASLLLAALSTALLATPVAYHRLVFRRHQKGRLLRVSNAMALSGLASVGLAISGAVYLVVSFVMRGLAVPLITGATVGGFAVLWFVLPLVARSESTGTDRTDADGRS